jgi:hypothetical protein
MRAANINVIKLYAGNPDLNAGAPGSAGNWKAFLDYCYNGGNKPIYVVMFSYTQGDVIAQGGTGLNNYIRQYTEFVKSTVKHPAVFGYLIGNEIFGGVTQNPQFWTNFGTLIDAAQGAGLSQGQAPFLMTATNDEFTPQTSCRRSSWVNSPVSSGISTPGVSTSIGDRNLAAPVIRPSRSIWL